jgi:hypothetical protein
LVVSRSWRRICSTSTPRQSSSSDVESMTELYDGSLNSASGR